MTISKTDKITIPTWILAIIMGVMIPLATSYSFNKTTLDKQEEKTAYNKEQIKKLESEKVDRSEFKIIQDQLLRIEQKLDRNGRIIQDKE